jgi:hypothetical protein
MHPTWLTTRSTSAELRGRRHHRLVRVDGPQVLDDLETAVHRLGDVHIHADVVLAGNPFPPDRPAPRRSSAQASTPSRLENRTGDRGRFWFVQYPFGFEPHLVEYEPFLSRKRLLLTPSFGELYKAQLVDEGEPQRLRHDLPVHRSETADSAI